MALFGNDTIDSYYNSILATIKPETIEQQIITTPEQTRDELRNAVRSYLNPQLKESLASIRNTTKQNVAEIDADASSRGMGSSTWLTDAKNRQYNSMAQNQASLYNNYNSALASAVEEQYANYLNRKQAVDTQNAANKIEVDEWNSQVKTALEKLAYERALNSYNTANAGSYSRGYSSGSGSDGNTDSITIYDADKILSDSTNSKSNVSSSTNTNSMASIRYNDAKATKDTGYIIPTKTYTVKGR